MENQKDLFQLNLDKQVREQMIESAKWGRVIAVAGFVILGTFALLMILAFTVATQYTDGVLWNTGPEDIAGAIIGGVIFLFLGFIPLYFLFLYSSRMKLALSTENSSALAESFRNLKRTFRYLAVWMLIMAGMTAISMIVTLLSGGT